MSDCIFEIGVEEMPARFVPKLAEQARELFTAALDEAMIEHGQVATYATPRRIAVSVADVADVQKSVEEEVSGPPVSIAYDADGNLTKAGAGFARTQGVDEAALYTITTDKGEYLAAKKTAGGGRTIDILPGICTSLLSALSFPKKMRWGAYDVAFGRPVRWLLALLGDTVVPFELAGMASGRTTFGHRVMGPGPFELADAGQYVDVLENQGKVVLDPERRKAMVIEEGDKLAAQVGGEIVWKESLLEEVCNLVERPVPILGSFDTLYLDVPREVLLTSMQSHQKSFGVQGPNGKLLPHFLTTLNLEPSDLELVRKGWERVLKARLEDARFFWEADCKTDMDVWLGKLDKVVFIGPLGTMGDKTRRIEALCRHLAEKAAPAEADAMARAGRLSKADLVSEMVIEFDSVQGIMGGIYARRAGLGDVVADGIYEQYLPAGPDSPVPASLAGAIVSMADKADTLVGIFGLGKAPTGANDPYALRRCALGISRIIMEHGLDVDLAELIDRAQAGYAGVDWKLPADEAKAALLEFFAQRLRALFTGQGFETRVVDAAIGAGFADIRTLKARLDALAAFSRTDGFEQAVLTFKRAANIIRKQAAEMELSGAYDAAGLEEPQEKALAARLEETAPRFDGLWKQGDFAGLFGLLAELRPAVDEFFDHVMVMCDDETLRTNRLNLLAALVGRLGRLADFGALQV